MKWSNYIHEFCFCHYIQNKWIYKKTIKCYTFLDSNYWSVYIHIIDLHYVHSSIYVEEEKIIYRNEVDTDFL